jgi:hypothetical protein
LWNIKGNTPKRIERKNRYLILLKGEKLKAKGCYKGQKSKGSQERFFVK